jgi:hypothetical protein
VDGTQSVGLRAADVVKQHTHKLRVRQSTTPRPAASHCSTHRDVFAVEHLAVEVEDVVAGAQVGGGAEVVGVAQAERHRLGLLVARALGVLVALLGLVGAVELADLVDHWIGRNVCVVSGAVRFLSAPMRCTGTHPRPRRGRTRRGPGRGPRGRPCGTWS